MGKFVAFDDLKDMGKPTKEPSSRTKNNSISKKKNEPKLPTPKSDKRVIPAPNKNGTTLYSNKNNEVKKLPKRKPFVTIRTT